MKFMFPDNTTVDALAKAIASITPHDEVEWRIVISPQEKDTYKTKKVDYGAGIPESIWLYLKQLLLTDPDLQEHFFEESEVKSYSNNRRCVTTNGVTIYQRKTSKERVDIHLTEIFLRFSVAHEENIPKITNERIEYTRLRLRDSFVYPTYRVDMTKLQGKYELEIELTNPDITSLNSLMQPIKDILDKLYPEHEYMMLAEMHNRILTLHYDRLLQELHLTNAHNYPINLKRQDISLLNGFFVTNKLNGVGKRIYVFEKNIYLYQNQILQIIGKFGGSHNLSSHESILEGEWYQRGFYVFDILVHQRKDLTNFNLADRLSKAREVIGELAPIFAANKYTLQIKQFYHSENLHKDTMDIMEYMKTTYPTNYIGENDGIIYTSPGKYSTPGVSIYKWKFPSLVTIDFRVEDSNPKEGKVFNTSVLNHYRSSPEYVLFYGSNDHKVDYNPKLVLDENDPLFGSITKHSIVECKLHVEDVTQEDQPFQMERFEAYRLRTDKGKPNRINVAQDNWDDMIRPFEFQELLDVIEKIPKTGQLLDFPYASKCFPPFEIGFHKLLTYTENIVNKSYTLEGFTATQSNYKTFRTSPYYVSNGNYCLVITDPKDYTEIDYLSDLFQENVRLKCLRTDAKITPWDLWLRDGKRIIKQTENVHRNSRKNRPLSQLDIRQAFFAISKEVTNFKPTLALFIYEQFKPLNILDMCAGWGDRMIAAAAYVARSESLDPITYTAYDPNLELRPGHDNLKKLLIELVPKISAPNFDIIYQPFETSQLLQEYDLAFTSPPFFDLEVYSNDKTQSLSQYTTLESWLHSFLFVLADKAWQSLRPGGHLVIHLNDTRHAMCEPLLQYMSTKSEAIWKGAISCIGVKGKARPLWVWQKNFSDDISSIEITMDSLSLSHEQSQVTIDNQSFDPDATQLLPRIEESNDEDISMIIKSDSDDIIEFVQPIHPPAIPIRQDLLKNMRVYHNNVKRTLINTYVKTSTKVGKKVLDLGFGFGGDIHKYYDANIAKLYGVEPNPENAAEARSRIAEKVKVTNVIFGKKIVIIEQKAQNSLQIKERLKINRKNEETLMDVVAAFFSLTFFFESAHNVEKLINTVAGCLKIGGYFIGTFMDGDRTHKFIGDQETVIVPNTYSIHRNYEVSQKIPSYGMKININLEGTIVTEQVEYLAFFSIFTAELKKHGLELVDRQFFDPPPNVPEQIRSLSSLFSTFVFKRVENKSEIQTREAIQRQSDSDSDDEKKDRSVKMLSVDKSQKLDTIYTVDDSQYLLRSGVIGEGSCLFHSIFTSTSERYRQQSISARKEIIRDFRAALATSVPITKWRKIGNGNLSQIIFTTSLSEQFNSMINKQSPLVKKYPQHFNNIIKILETNRDLNNLQLIDKIVNLFSEKLPKTREAIRTLCVDIEKQCYDVFIDDLTDCNSDIGPDTPSRLDIFTFLSNALKHDIYLIRDKTRAVYISTDDCKDRFKHRPSIIVLSVNSNHFESIGRIIDPTQPMKEDNIQRIFPANDPLIMQMYKAICEIKK